MFYPLLRLPSASFLLATLLFVGGCDQALPPPPNGGPPYEPADALTTFELETGFEITLVAAEPLVTDPVAMEIDEDGRIYVIEMPGYPLDARGSGRVKVLQDTDGDGAPDRAVVFAEGLTLPTGLMRWKQGLLVTDPPDVLYLADTDGDGRADERRVVLTGFALSNAQHNVNKPLYGLDNWIYLANNGPISTEKYAGSFGDRGAEIHFPDHPDAPRLARNGSDRNVRFRLDERALEVRSGNSQFGQTFDAWGHHFLLNNSHHQYHEVIAARYFARNPDLPVRRATHDTPDHGNAATVYPITINPEHQLLTDRGVFTSACGLTYYLGGAFPPPYDRNITFVAEPVHNLIHVDQVIDNGATFTARRLREGREFLASTDSWFRPVSFTIGPDGALYVVDYYRQIVEHPEWMDDERAQSGTLTEGTDRGRIYRITATGSEPLAWNNQLALGDADTASLVAALERSNLWWRIHAQRLLVDRQDEAAVALLARLVRESTAPEARVHALWTLDGLGGLDPALVERALQDPSPGVRENAIRLAEQRLETTPSLRTALLALKDDPDPKVRFQLLNTLGDVDTDAAREARQHLLFNDIEDEWTQTAALLARPDAQPTRFNETVAQLTDRETDGRKAYLKRIAAIIGAGPDDAAIRGVIETVTTAVTPASAWWRGAGLAGLAEGMRRRRADVAGLALPRERLLDSFFIVDDDGLREALLDLLETIALPPGPRQEAALERAGVLAVDTTIEAARRADAVRLLALTGPDQHQALLLRLLDPQEPATVQRAALRALKATTGLEAPTYLLDHWNTLTPDLREEGVEVFMSEDRAPMLLDAVENQIIQPATLGWQRRVRLMRDTEEPLRSRARALLSQDESSQEALLERYREALSQAGDLARGEAVFTRVCAACHASGDVGQAAFGPDLATVQHWPRQALLAKILNPNRSIADGYELWFVERQSGGILTGVIIDETPTSLTVRTQSGEQTLPRTDITAITTSSTSAMPAGLDTQLSIQEMSDLLAFLRREER